LGVRIDDWNFDAGIHGRFWYDAHVTIHRGDGQLVASMPVKGQEVIEGRWGDEARLKAREEMPALYESFIKKLVRENPEVIAAIAQTRPTNQDSPAALLPRSGP
ncbi:MAG TPA: hypothetical protein VFS13_11540, partial [Steroidobacteraceae bacterium]|nr:hypothetical protein [Steroidobacteraceae bacterium]